MRVTARAGVYLDALTVRNHAPFAAFACSTHYRNLKKVRMFASHWDKQVPHVGYFAYRDIQVRALAPLSLRRPLWRSCHLPRLSLLACLLSSSLLTQTFRRIATPISAARRGAHVLS